MATHRRHLLRHLLLSLWLALIGAFVAMPTDPARAGVIFRYESACTPTPCPDVDLSTGDPVSGLIEFASSAVVPNATLSHLDIIGFSLDFGTIDIVHPTAFFWFTGTLDATAQGFTDFLLIAGDSFESLGSVLMLDLIGWAGAAGTCLSQDCFDFMAIDGSFGIGATIARLIEEPNPIPVPEPSSALLALASIGLLTRRRGRRA